MTPKQQFEQQQQQQQQKIQNKVPPMFQVKTY